MERSSENMETNTIITVTDIAPLALEEEVGGTLVMGDRYPCTQGCESFCSGAGSNVKGAV